MEYTDKQNYEQFKQAWLLKFKLTPEAYRCEQLCQNRLCHWALEILSLVGHHQWLYRFTQSTPLMGYTSTRLPHLDLYSYREDPGVYVTIFMRPSYGGWSWGSFSPFTSSTCQLCVTLKPSLGPLACRIRATSPFLKQLVWLCTSSTSWMRLFATAIPDRQQL